MSAQQKKSPKSVKKFPKRFPNIKKNMCNLSHIDVSEAKKIMGKNSRDISKILGYEGRDEIIHKDDLVKFSI